MTSTNADMQPEQGTVECLEDPATIARVVRLLIKFGWPPPEADDLAEAA